LFLRPCLKKILHEKRGWWCGSRCRHWVQTPLLQKKKVRTGHCDWEVLVKHARRSLLSLIRQFWKFLVSHTHVGVESPENFWLSKFGMRSEILSFWQIPRDVHAASLWEAEP
jgi:hypothetical protein